MKNSILPEHRSFWLAGYSQLKYQKNIFLQQKIQNIEMTTIANNSQRHLALKTVRAVILEGFFFKIFWLYGF